MSRCSLRLDQRSLPRSRAGADGRGSSSSLRPRQHLASCAEHLLLGTPRTAPEQSLPNSSIHSLASDASLISSLLDESSIQESTLVDTFWGLDEEADPTESSTAVKECSSLIGSHTNCAKHPLQMLSRVYCRDCRHQGLKPRVCSQRRSTGDDCKEKQRSQDAPPPPWASAPALLASMGSALVFTGGLACDAFRWIRKRWRSGNTSSHQSRRPLFVLLSLLLLCIWFWFRPDVLPAVGVPEENWENPPDLLPEDAVEEFGPPPPPETPQQVPVEELQRLWQMEQSLRALWEQVEAAGREAEQRHAELLQLYSRPLRPPPQHQSVELWVSRFLEQQLGQLHRQLSRGQQREQQNQVLLRSQTTRLDQLELQLQAATARPAAPPTPPPAAPPTSLPAAVGGGVEVIPHDALQKEVLQLEAEDGRRSLEAGSGCHDGCKHADDFQQTISGQVSDLVQEKVRALVYGNQLTQGEDSAPSEPLLQWLSQRFISQDNLQEALSSLELHMPQNISRTLQRGHGQEPVSAGNAVTKEEVHAVVRDALRRFAEDRTGRADYALESAGGSVLSSSHTYRTKVALLSLFGVPLWYFTQSPRAVIQPDVQPGNCWAFKGSSGFLVIRLSMSILPNAITVEHIPKALSPSGALHSAPRDFRIYGLRDEGAEPETLLGMFSYDEDGDALQTFSLSEDSSESFQIMEVQVLSNWGHPEYTCMYRLRVHGTPSEA